MLQALTRAVDIGRPAMFVRLRDSSVVGGGGPDRRGLDALHPFGDLDDILQASEFLAKAPDADARAFNEAYRRSLAPDVRDDPANRSAYPWDRLDETFRQANRDVVAHVPAKLSSAGVPPRFWRGIRGLPRLSEGALYTDEAGLEALSELEHERWSAQRRMDGWRWEDIPRRDDLRRVHPSLVPYDALTDEVKEFDRGNVRGDPGGLLAFSKAWIRRPHIKPNSARSPSPLREKACRGSLQDPARVRVRSARGQ